MLEEAVNDYIKLRNDPNGLLVTHGILPTKWYSPKHHLLRHYPEWVQSKGVLPFCSTDRTEPLHKLHKVDFKKSNKGPQFSTFLLKNERRASAFARYETGLFAEDIFEECGVECQDDDDVTGEDQGEAEIDEDLSKVVRLTSKGRWQGERNLEQVEKQLKLENLVSETKKFLEFLATARVSRTVPDWLDGGVITAVGYSMLSVRYATVHDHTKHIRETLRSTETYGYGKNADWKKPRYDTVLIRYDQTEGNHTMSNRKVAHLRLLFSIEVRVPGEDDFRKLDLAYVQLFSVVGNGADPLSGMFKVRKDRYTVIDIATIERGVHLVPCFSSLETQMADAKSSPSLDVYTDFWLNNYVDVDMYNTVYE